MPSWCNCVHVVDHMEIMADDTKHVRNRGVISKEMSKKMKRKS